MCGTKFCRKLGVAVTAESVCSLVSGDNPYVA